MSRADRLFFVRGVLAGHVLLDRGGRGFEITRWVFWIYSKTAHGPACARFVQPFHPPLSPLSSACTMTLAHHAQQSVDSPPRPPSPALRFGSLAVHAGAPHDGVTGAVIEPVREAALVCGSICRC